MTTQNNPEFIQKLNAETEAKFSYDWIDSPLFEPKKEQTVHTEISNRPLRIFYFIKRANVADAPYLIFFNGGPGLAISDMFFAHQYGSFLPNLNIVFMDQRGTGLSSRPSSNLKELKYFSARYIALDAELIRKKLLGDAGKWIVFGQSYGGVVSRKYLEIFPESVGLAITHGSAKYNAVDVAENMELNTSNRLNEYFKKYPDDHALLIDLQKTLVPQDFIASSDYRVSGKNLIHLLSIFFAIYPDDQMHSLISKIDKEKIVSSFIESVRPLSEQLLKAGALNSALALIDLTEGIATLEVANKALSNLHKKGTTPENLLISKLMLDLNTEVLSKEERKLEKMIRSGDLVPDPTQLEIVKTNVARYGFNFHVFGSSADALAINSIKDEQEYMKKTKAVHVFYHFSGGTHREWLQNKDLFTEVISNYRQELGIKL